VGLLQREIEAAGLATITLSPIADFTAAVGAPRVAAIEYPGCQLLGRPHDVAGQTAVLRATLSGLAKIEQPGSVVHLPFEWPLSPKETDCAPPEPPPIVGLIMKRPWNYRRLLTGDIPGNDA
jgi:D-proline reductase (dithiol) PrdB